MNIKSLQAAFAIVFCFVASVSIAQTQQGSFIAGGNISLSFKNQEFDNGSTTIDVGSQNDIAVRPTFAYFIKDGLAVGAMINISRSKFESDDGQFEDTDNIFSIGPMVRYYHDSGLFGHAYFGFGSANSSSTSGGSEFETDRGLTDWMVGPGYAIFLNESVAVEGLLTYGATTITNNDSDPETKEILKGIMFSVGFTIFIN